MALSITEKNHWKDRIAQRIDKRVNQIKCANPEFFQKISEQAKAEAIKRAKIGKEMSRLLEIEGTKAALATEEEKLLKSVYRTLYGKECDSSSYYLRNHIDSRIEELQRHHEEALLREDSLGRELSGLLAEKESLLDTVWLATSPRQVTDLWVKALKLLGEETTGFQQDVLSTKDQPEG